MVRQASERPHGQTQANLGLAPWPWLPMPVWNPFLAAVENKGGNGSEPITAVGTEWMDFVNRRLQEGMALPQKLVACKGPDEMWRAYSEFLLKMAEDYQMELSELAKLGQRIAPNGHSAR